MTATTPSPVPLDHVRGDRIELPSGGWVILMPLSGLRVRHRQAIADTLPGTYLGPGAMLRMQREVMRIMILAWGGGELDDKPLPSSVPPPTRLGDPAEQTVEDPLLDLEIGDENRLIAAVSPALKLINPDQVDPAQVDNPDSPTEPVGDSEPS